MKKIFFLLIAVCSVVMASAQTSRKKTTNDLPPRHVVEVLNNVMESCGTDSTQIYSVEKNPNTNMLESSIRIMSFVSPRGDFGGDEFDPIAISRAFIRDEPLSYQILHLTPGSNENFSLKALLENGSQSANFRVRTNRYQEMWLMCTKNPTNPQLRDAYAIVWQKDGDERVYGKVFMITSLRPDLYERNQERSASTFRIDGRVGSDLKDSLYVFFMADSYEELKELRVIADTYEELKELDDERVAYMPVNKNGEFGISVEIERRKCGAIRTVMPDGSLCELWTNLDMVPGKTYRITTHNGFYEGDNEYERTVGRYSGQSMIAGHDNDDVEGDTLAVYQDGRLIEDTVAVDYEDDVYRSPNVNHALPKDFSMEAVQKVNELAGQIMFRLELLEERYQGLEQSLRPEVVNGFNLSGQSWYKAVDYTYDYIDRNNKLLDKDFEKMAEVASKTGVYTKSDAYREMIDRFAEQNKHYDMLIKKFGFYSKTAAKCQKTIARAIEKYSKLMNKAMAEGK